ncbi:MAG: NADH-quinone oxidoreductase subunit J family protein [Acidimicrobiales bacterium]
METVVFVISAVIVLGGAIGVVVSPNPVHSALSLVATLFGIAVLFVAQEAHFLAAVQVIVYAGAIVVLFLFVIMLLGVDRVEDLRTDPLGGQRPLAVIAGVALLGVTLVALVVTRTDMERVVTGTPSVAGELTGGEDNLEGLAESLFTDYLFAFEITSVLLVIAVVAAVVLARRSHRGDLIDEDRDRPTEEVAG